MDKLTKTEEKILQLVNKFGSHPDALKTISKRRCTSIRNTQKIIKKLRAKGWVDKKGSQTPMPIIKQFATTQEEEQEERYYRLHNIHIVITPYYFYRRYKKNIKKIIPIGKWTITINTKNIEIQLQRKKSFDNIIIDKTWEQARLNIQKTILIIENDTGCEIWKNRKANIKLVNHHMAEVKNGIATLMKGKKFKIKGEDGKVWLVIDQSIGVPELETVHSILATDDAKLLSPFFNDMRNNNPPTNSELKYYITENSKLMNHYGKHWKTHVEVLKEIKCFIRGQRKYSERFLSQPSRRQHSQQSSLQQYIG